MMALSSASVFNPLSLSAGDKVGRKFSAAGAGKNRLESPPSCGIQIGVGRRQFAWTSGARTIPQRRRSSGCGIRRLGCGIRRLGCGIRRLTVSAAENDRSNESESSGDVEAMESRLGLGRRARRQQQAGGERQDSNPGSAPAKAKEAKEWKSMSLPEKAWSVYIDPKKGVLFWLNKLAYGAIFVIIGSWITFRFIGPALGWYQLDQPLLAPDRIFNSGP